MCVCHQLGLKETHGIRGTEEPGSDLLHEQPPTDTLLHQPAAPGRSAHLCPPLLSSTLFSMTVPPVPPRHERRRSVCAEQKLIYFVVVGQLFAYLKTLRIIILKKKSLFEFENYGKHHCTTMDLFCRLTL